MYETSLVANPWPETFPVELQSHWSIGPDLKQISDSVKTSGEPCTARRWGVLCPLQIDTTQTPRGYETGRRQTETTGRVESDNSCLHE